MDEVEIDEEKVRLALSGMHDVGVPKLLGQRFCHREDNFTSAFGRKFVSWIQPQGGVGSLTFTTSWRSRPAAS